MEVVRPGAPPASLTISFQPAWKVRRHSVWGRMSMPAFWWQKGQVPVADFRRLERGMGGSVDSVQIWSMPDSRFSRSAMR